VTPKQANPLMNEDSLARRVTYERELRHWSPGGLARKMTAAGCPMNQSAIWKIEHGQPRRKITVDEAMAFARVFDTTLEDLLNPPELVTESALNELLSKYEEHFAAAIASQIECNAIAIELDDLLAEHPEVREALGDALRRTFPDSPLVDEAADAILHHAREREDFLRPQRRWWTHFSLLHKSYRRLLDSVPPMWTDEEAESMEAEIRDEREAGG
jgi:hypothetical protein